ncbi:MAG TPA: LamG-like jellyroll fold domain-containing protein [Puia sp.]|nr:LamG-like jellyroll fold domain-containing protein [Puia sp.]
MKKKTLILVGFFVLLLSVQTKTFSQVNLDSGLVAYYPFNGNANDASGHNLNGNLLNGVQLTTDKYGNANSAYHFDGVDDFIQIPDNPSFNPTTGLTIALYFNPEQNGTQTLIGKIDYTGGVGTQFQVAMDFPLYPGVLFGVNPPSNDCAGVPLNGAYVNTTSPIGINQWYCVVATFDNGIQKIYLNGTLIQTTTASFNNLNQCLNAGIQIGSWWQGDPQRFKGKIDEVRIYGRAINQQEVSALCDLCNQPQGSLIGSAICSGNTGTLTFNSTVGTAPFSIQYSDGTTTFTQNNVQSGVPFNVATNPTITTTYVMKSLTDATACPRTIGFIQDTTKIIVSDCKAVCASSKCPLSNSLVINTGYDAATQTSLQPGQKDTNWIVTAMSDDLRNAFCNSNTSGPTQPSGVSVPPVSIGQPALAIQAFFQWPPTGTYVSCFPYNTIYTNVPTVDNYTNCTMGITRTFYVCSSSNEDVNFNLNLTTDNNTTGVIIDAGTANAITLYTGAAGLFTPVLINMTENLAPGLHTLTITGADYEDVTAGSYFNLPSGTISEWNPFGIALTGTISSANNIFVDNCPLQACNDLTGTLTGSSVCSGTQAFLTFNTLATSGPFTLKYTNGIDTITSTNVLANTPFNLSVTPNTNTKYILLSVKDSTNCPQTNIIGDTAIVIINPLPKAYLTGGNICIGDSAVLLFTATSGTSPFNIAYSANSNAYALIGLNNNSTFTIPYLLNDTTVVHLSSITDANGCSSSLDTSTTVNVVPLPQGGLTGNSACAGDSAGITFNATSGTGPFEVEISDGTNTTVYYDVLSGIPFHIAPLNQTTTVTLLSIIDKDGAGCTRSGGFTSPTATISVNPSPQIQFDPLTAICIQQSSFLITQASETTGIAGSGSFSGAGVDASGNFSPTNAGVGSHEITYTYTATNGCSSSDSSSITVNPTPVISAGVDIITCLGFPVQLNATGGSTYIWSPLTGLNNPSIRNPVATLDSTTTYIVLGTDSNGCYASDTITINVGKNGIAAFVVPNAFTPNGDGKNDCFGIRRWGGVTVVEFSIFNRWGQLVFTTKDPSDCWDGTLKGTPQPAGGYPYIIKAKTPCGDVTRTGIVILVR